MSDTIFYKGKLKRGKKPIVVFEKLKKGIKKKGPTKNWECIIGEDEQRLIINFHDDESESFVLEFNQKSEFNGFCKVCFPLEGEAFEDGKSEFKALLDLLYQAKSMFHSIEIKDDYGLAESYWDSKRFKFDLRELTPEEEARVRRLYSQGNISHEQLLWAIMAEDMGMPLEEFCNYISFEIRYNGDYLPEVTDTLETYLYETAALGKQGRLCEINPLIYNDPGNALFSVFAFKLGLSWVFFDGTGRDKEINLEKESAFSPKDAQVGLLFRERFAPLFIAEKEPLAKCILVYRYFVSVYEFLGFQYVGRAENINTKPAIDIIMEEYGEEKAAIFLTGYCTTVCYFFSSYGEEHDRYVVNWRKNMLERYGEELFKEYRALKNKYEENARFRVEVKKIVAEKGKYVDETLVK